MSTPRPTSVTVIAVLLIVFGALGVCGAIQAGSMLASGMKMEPAGEYSSVAIEWYKIGEKKLNERMPAHKAFTAAAALLDLGFSVAMLVAGVGLLKMESWGRRFTLAYAGLGLVKNIGVAAVNLLFIGPAMREALDELPIGYRVSTAPFLELSLALMRFGVIVPIAFQVVLLVIFRRPSIARLFSLQETDGSTGNRGIEAGGTSGTENEARRPT